MLRGQTLFDDRRSLAARVRAFAAFTGFAAGLVLSREMPDVATAAWAGVGTVAAAIAVLAAGRVSTIALLIAMLGAGGAVWSSRVHDRAPDSVAAAVERQAADGSASVFMEIEGIALSDPERLRPKRGELAEHVPPFMRGEDRVRLPVAIDLVHTADGPRVGSGVAVVLAAPPVAARAGDRVRALGRAVPTGAASNPGAPSYTASSRVRGDSFWLVAGEDALIRTVDHPTAASKLRSRLLALLAIPRRSASAIIDRATDPARGDDAGALIRGLLLGERDVDGPGLAGAFQRIGLAHLLSVSGFHVAVMAFIALFVVRATGDRGWIEPALIAVAIALYVLVVPARSPIVRAGIMVLALLISEALGRRHDRLALLAWVGVGVLVWRPDELWSIGFQLSFGLVAWLMTIAEPRPDALKIDDFDDPAAAPLWRGVVGWFGDMARATAACWSISIPVVLYHTGAFAPLAVLATLITVPMVVVTMWLGFALLLLGLFVPPLIDPIAAMLRVSAGVCAGFVRWFDTVPIATVHLPNVSLVWTVASTAVAIWLWRRGRVRSVVFWALPAAMIAWLMVESHVGQRLPSTVAARATMLNVGDGTAIVVESGGEALLWDCGSFREDIGVRVIPNACRAIGAPRVTTVIITHANIDHFMGLPDFATKLGVREVITGESFARAAEEDGAARALLDVMQVRGITHRVVSAGDSITLGDATLDILHPPPGFVARHENDASLVARLTHNNTDASMLLTGDIQDEAMAMLMTSGVDLSADVIELPHHGSAREAAYAFVERVNPRVVLQSTGRQRLNDPRWDHARAGRAWLDTPRFGAVRADLRTDSTVSAGPVR
ncbi:MAG: ComEC/Rec2 family competence protein [Planctomycetota bacterium]